MTPAIIAHWAPSVCMDEEDGMDDRSTYEN